MSQIEPVVRPPTPPRRPRCRPLFAWSLVLVILLGAILCGINLRRWAWDQTTNIRFVNSVSNAIEWGRYANKVGVLQLYDSLLNEHGDAGDYNGPARFALDYPPLRLFIACQWTDWAQRTFPPPPGQQITWSRDYIFTRPMLLLNMAAELLSAIGMFLLVRRWVRTCKAPRPLQPSWRKRLCLWRPSAPNWQPDDPSKAPPLAGLVPATIAFLLVWFNPALIWNAQVYPQWDVWLLPSFLFAVYFALRNWWVPAGLVIGIAAMAKGQILFVAPMLVAWPLLRGWVWASARLLIGFAAGVGLVVWPWLLMKDPAYQWILRTGLGMAIMLPAFFLPRRGRLWLTIRLVLSLIGGTVIAWPWVRMQELQYTAWVLGLSLLLVAGATLLPWRSLAAWLAFGWAGSLVLTVPIFGATMAWLWVGLMYGTRHWKQLFWCQAANLGAILQVRFQWRFESTLDLAGYLPWNSPWVVPIRHFIASVLETIHLGDVMPVGDTCVVPLRGVMTAGFVLTLILCTIGLTLQHRRRDYGFFYALMAPWLLAYAILPQMIERYLIWPAVICAAAASVRVGGFLLYLAITALGWIMMIHYMLKLAPRDVPKKQYLPYFEALFPDLGWAVLILAGVCLYLALRPTPRSTSQESASTYL